MLWNVTHDVAVFNDLVDLRKKMYRHLFVQRKKMKKLSRNCGNFKSDRYCVGQIQSIAFRTSTALCEFLTLGRAPVLGCHKEEQTDHSGIAPRVDVSTRRLDFKIQVINTIEGSRGGHSDDCLQNSLRPLRNFIVIGGSPSIALLIGSNDFIAYCDASKKGLGGVLMQREKCDVRSHDLGLFCTEPSVWVLHRSQEFATHFGSKRERTRTTAKSSSLGLTIVWDLPKDLNLLSRSSETRVPENIKSGRRLGGNCWLNNAKFTDAIRETKVGTRADGT
ncbi:hypothetical protein Tco_0404462 [Tanacetum coccineum]